MQAALNRPRQQDSPILFTSYLMRRPSNVTKHQTQTERYWTNQFKIEPLDFEYLYKYLLEQEKPLSSDALALMLVRNRFERLVEGPEPPQGLANGKPLLAYQPDASYEVGQTLVLSTMGDAKGKIVAVRPGNNPDYGPFSVISVRLEDEQVIELASNFLPSHVLNSEPEFDEYDDTDDDGLTAEDVFIEYGGFITEALDEYLEAHETLVHLSGQWFPKALLAEVNEGHLNLAEAVLDMYQGGPMSTLDIVEQIGMLQDIATPLAEFSFNYALLQDPRFDEVGRAGEVCWFLHRMEPEPVVQTPVRLEYRPIEYNQDDIVADLRGIEAEIDDEKSPPPRERPSRQSSVRLTLNFPHLRAGTLPLTPQLKRLFPHARSASRIRFNFLDTQTNTEFPGWVVRAGGYVYGLREWTEEHGLTSGTYISIMQLADSQAIGISFEPHNRREWVLTASVHDNRLHFETKTQTMVAAYDELAVVVPDDVAAVDKLWQLHRDRNTPLHDLMRSIILGLAPLNPQQHVHAKTLYYVLNLVRRCPPGPIFALLTASGTFQHAGGPYWRLADGQ